MHKKGQQLVCTDPASCVLMSCKMVLIEIQLESKLQVAMYVQLYIEYFGSSISQPHTVFFFYFASSQS